MKRNFQREKNAHAAGAVAGSTAHIASVLAAFALCYAFTPSVVAAGSSLLTDACNLAYGNAGMPETFSADIGSSRRICRQRGGTVAFAALDTSRLDPCDEPVLRAAYVPTAAAPDSSGILAMTALPIPDRHWCMARAFNAALDRRRLDPAARQAPAVVLR